MIFGCWAFPVFNITLNVVLQTRYQTEFLGLWQMFLLNIKVHFLKSSVINIRPTSDLNSSFIRYSLYWFHKGNWFDKRCIFEVLLPYGFRESFLKNASPYSISHAHVSAMFLQTRLNQTASIFWEFQARSWSQPSVRIKHTFQNMKGQAQKAWKPLKKDIILHKKQMETKTKYGASVTTEALWKRQNWIWNQQATHVTLHI